jgi:hypothetical protein
MRNLRFSERKRRNTPVRTICEAAAELIRRFYGGRLRYEILKKLLPKSPSGHETGAFPGFNPGLARLRPKEKRFRAESGV